MTVGDLLFLAVEGQMPREGTMPTIWVDRRYGLRTAAQLATRARHPAARKAAALGQE